MSFNDVVGAEEQCGRNFKAERLGGLQMTWEFVSDRMSERMETVTSKRRATLVPRPSTQT